MSARRIPAVLMRGGASRGVFFHTNDLPAIPRARDAVLLRAVGAPDPSGRGADGAGGAGDRVVVVSRSAVAGCDIEFLCGAVEPDGALIDWGGPCGALAAAVASFAIGERLYPAADGLVRVRMRHIPQGLRIDAFVPVRGGEVTEEGDFVEDGVPFASSEVRLELIEPSEAPFPSGAVRDTLEVAGIGPIDATLVSVGSPTVFVRADALGLNGRESPAELERTRRALDKLEAVRQQAASRLGLGRGASAGGPRVCWVARPAGYRSTQGAEVPAEAIDLLARFTAAARGPGGDAGDPGEGAIALAVAAAVPGTVVAEVARTLPGVATRIGHAGGILAIGAEVSQLELSGGRRRWRVDRCVLSSSARRLMGGVVHVPRTG
jgi:2-methylaconitate cis-trans-isomerase PrpF